MTSDAKRLTAEEIDMLIGDLIVAHPLYTPQLRDMRALALSALDREAVLEEPWAWAVHQDGGGEFDYLVYPNREDADRDADIHEKETIPLYPLRALKREPNAAGWNEKGIADIGVLPGEVDATAEPAPAAPRSSRKP